MSKFRKMKKPYINVSLKTIFVLFLVLGLTGCKDKNTSKENKQVEEEKVTGAFQEDYDFLKKHSEDIILLQSGKSMVAISPSLQGRVMTSSKKDITFTNE